MKLHMVQKITQKRKNKHECWTLADESEENYGCYPLVYEDENGDRFYTHCDIKGIEEVIMFEEKETSL